MGMDRLQKSVQAIKDPKKRKAEYYKRQREDAEETGNQKTTDKIYSKMGKKSHSVDSSKVDKGILGSVALAAGGGLEGLGVKAAMRGLGKAAPKAAEAVGKVGSSLAKKAGSAVDKVYQNLGKARPVAKKLTSGGAKAAGKTAMRQGEKQAAFPGEKRSLPGGKPMKNVTPKSVAGSKPKALTNQYSDYEHELGNLQKPKSGPVAARGKERVALNPSTGKTSGISQQDAKRMRQVENSYKRSQAPDNVKQNKDRDAMYAAAMKKKK